MHAQHEFTVEVHEDFKVPSLARAMILLVERGSKE